MLVLKDETGREIQFPDIALLDSYVFWTQVFETFRAGAHPRGILDVGACIGSFALPARRRWPKAEIICVEPNPCALPFLRTNMADLRGVSILPFAASDATGEAMLKSGRALGWASLHRGQGDGVPVPCAPLDNCISDPIDVLKIDVEGHESAVLLGARGIISQFRPDLVVEIKGKRQPGGQAGAQRLGETIIRMGYEFMGRYRGDYFFRPSELPPP